MKLSILSNVSTQYLSQNILKILSNKYKIEIYEAPFGTWQIAARGLDTDLKDFNPDSILIFLSSSAVKHDSLENFEFQKNVLESINSLNDWFRGKVYISSIDYCDSSLLNSNIKISIDKLNMKLFELSKSSNFIFIDLFGLLLSEKHEIFSPHKYHGIGAFSFHPKFYYTISKRISAVMQATISRPIKIIFVDLDNTLWPGILGDDGIENINLSVDTNAYPHLSLQHLLKCMHNNGVLLIIVSKNNLETVESFFKIRKSEMILKWDDFTSVKANWEPKSKNIKKTLEELNLTSHGSVFIDDSEFERNEVRNSISEINVLELPKEPYDWPKFLSELEIFHTPIVTREDKERTNFYKKERDRLIIKDKMSENDYLLSLKLKIFPQKVTKSNVDRVIQLINKTNQFNISGTKVSYDEIYKYIVKKNHFIWTFSLEDIYSNYGLISSIYGKTTEDLKQIEIEGWVLSCRAFTRNVETAIIQFLSKTYSDNLKISIRFIYTDMNKYAFKYFSDNNFNIDNSVKGMGFFTKSLKSFTNVNTKISIRKFLNK